MPPKKSFPPILILIALALIWGTSFILIKQGLKVFAPEEVGALRVSAAAIILIPIALTKLKELNQAHYFRLFLAGLMGTVIPSFLFAFAQTRLSSSVAGILNTLSPLWTIIFGALFFRQRFKPIVIIGIVLSFGGAILLALSRSSGSISGINGFALLIVLACACYGMNLNWVKFRIPELSSLTITSVALALTGPFGIVYLLGFTDFTYKMSTNAGAWKAFGFICLLALMSTAIATVLFNKLVKIKTPLYASSVTYLMPIVSVMWGVLDGEELVFFHFLGMALILGGVYLANRKKMIRSFR
jgi:drug/metabolite transporter (DMT)-like permease